MGYLVCDECGGYYELQEGEKPDDFSDECECGGKLHYTETLEGFQDDYEESMATITCPFCGTENPDDSVICQKCGEKMVIEPGNDALGHLYEDEQLLNKKGKTIQEYGTGLRAKYKRKELKMIADVQEIIDIKGYYLVKGKDDTEPVKILSEGLKIGDGQFINFEDINSVEMDEDIRQEKSGINRLIKAGTSLFDSGKRNLRILSNNGEFLLEDVKTSDAKKLVSFVNRKK